MPRRLPAHREKAPRLPRVAPTAHRLSVSLPTDLLSVSRSSSLPANFEGATQLLARARQRLAQLETRQHALEHCVATLRSAGAATYFRATLDPPLLAPAPYRRRGSRKASLLQPAFVTALQQTRARRGLWNGGYAPLGYDLVDGRLVLNPEEADLVREIFRLYAEDGLSVNRVGERLYQLRIPGKWTRVGTRHQLRSTSTWNPSGLYRLLLNSAYIGQAVWGRKKNPRPWLPQEEVIIPVPRIISDALWEKAQQRLARNRHFRPRDKRYPYLVSGLVRCQICERCLCAVTAQNTALSYYFCIRKAYRWIPRCPNAVRYRVADVDAAVWGVIVQGLASSTALDEIIAQALQTDTLPAVLDEARLQRLEAEITAMEHRADEVLRLGAVSALAQARARVLLQELDVRHTTLVQERDQLAQQLRAPGQEDHSWHATLTRYRRWLQRTTWSESGLGAVPSTPSEDPDDLEAPAPAAHVRTLLFAVQQRIVRDLVDRVVLASDGSGMVYLQGSTTGLPIAVTALAPKMRKREQSATPVAPDLAAIAD